MKIGLGTANFLASYGAYKKKKFSFSDFKKISIISQKSKIFLIDTAIAYKGSHKILTSNIFSKFLIVSKIKVNKKSKSYLLDFKKKIQFLKKKFGKRLYAILIHNYDELDISKINNCFKELVEAKKRGCIKKFGISIYEPERLKILNKYWPDIVQAPFNVFDQRLLNSGWLKKILNRKIEVHARSCFLQGTLVEKKLPFYLKKYSSHFIHWHNWCYKNQINPIKGCLDFIKMNQKKFKFIIIGFNSLAQLKQIIKYYNSKTNINQKQFNIFNKSIIKLIDPRKWKK